VFLGHLLIKEARFSRVMKKVAFRCREGESLMSFIRFEQVREIAFTNTRTDWKLSEISR
jgi:hypothetical protein